MFFPIVPLLAIIAIVSGGVTLVWYDELNKTEKEKADRLACDYAQKLFGKSVKQLTKEEANQVALLTKQHFVGRNG